jgi:hypothetical protein
VRVFAAYALIAATAVGCGAPPADLFVVTRSGSIPGAGLKLLVSDGSVTCNDGPERRIAGDRLLTARELARDLEGPAERYVRLPPGPGAILRYRVRGEHGTVEFSDTSRRQPPVFFRLAAFTREIAKEVCGLER